VACQIRSSTQAPERDSLGRRQANTARLCADGSANEGPNRKVFTSFVFPLDIASIF
jgi:hypothetical protein